MSSFTSCVLQLQQPNSCVNGCSRTVAHARLALRSCSVIRRSTTLLVVAGEYWVFAKRPSRRSLAALLLMVGGAIVAGLTDLTFSLPGYAWVTICVVSTAAYLLLIRKLQESTGEGCGGQLHACQGTGVLHHVTSSDKDGGTQLQPQRLCCKAHVTTGHRAAASVSCAALPLPAQA
jgi:hypothetical protein